MLPHNVVLAPLAGITNHPFRVICRQEGASLAYTEMVSVNGLVREGAKTMALMNSSSADRPLGIQLFGDTADSLAEAARMVDGYGELIDINMGCPVRKVVGTGAGSALLKEPARIADIVRAVRRATRQPFTVKIRSGWHCGDNTFREIGRIVEAEGCDAITLHPRSRSQMFSGTAAWDQLRELKEAVSIPVLGSGDLFTPEDCLRMLEQTGCDGIMIARGALGAPWIFRQVAELAERGSYTAITNRRRAEIMRHHLELYCQEFGEQIATREMKKHLGWYARGFAGAAEIRRVCNTAREKHDLEELMERITAIPDGHHEQG